MPDLPDPTLCDHEFTFINVYYEFKHQFNYGGNRFYSLFICHKCGKIKRVWEKLDGN